MWFKKVFLPYILLYLYNLPKTHRQLDFIYQDAGSDPGVPVGALTTENRDVWTKAREEILSFSQRNKVFSWWFLYFLIFKDNFDIIETAAFAVCLDDSKPITKEERMSCLFNID